MLFRIVDPARTTGSEHGQRAAVSDPIQQLRAFLHDDDVGGKVGIVHRVKAQTAQSCGHLALHIGADGKAEFLA